MKLAIIGGGEMALELYNLVISCNKKDEYKDIFFVDLDEDTDNKIIAENDYFKTDRNESEILIAMGEPFMRKRMYEKYTDEGFKMTSFIHPLSFVSNDTAVGEGSIILPFVYVAQNTRIGRNVLLHSGSKIENDCVVGDNSFISSNAFIGAKTTVGENCFLGPGSSVRDSLVIGHDSIIGMGAVLTRSIRENSVCYGNPAKRIRENTTHKVFKY